MINKHIMRYNPYGILRKIIVYFLKLKLCNNIFLKVGILRIFLRACILENSAES